MGFKLAELNDNHSSDSCFLLRSFFLFLFLLILAGGTHAHGHTHTRINIFLKRYYSHMTMDSPASQSPFLCPFFDSADLLYPVLVVAKGADPIRDLFPRLCGWNVWKITRKKDGLIPNMLKTGSVLFGREVEYCSEWDDVFSFLWLSMDGSCGLDDKKSPKYQRKSTPHALGLGHDSHDTNQAEILFSISCDQSNPVMSQEDRYLWIGQFFPQPMSSNA